MLYFLFLLKNIICLWGWGKEVIHSLSVAIAFSSNIKNWGNVHVCKCNYLRVFTLLIHYIIRVSFFLYNFLTVPWGSFKHNPLRECAVRNEYQADKVQRENRERTVCLFHKLWIPQDRIGHQKTNGTEKVRGENLGAIIDWQFPFGNKVFWLVAQQWSPKLDLSFGQHCRWILQSRYCTSL